MNQGLFLTLPIFLAFSQGQKIVDTLYGQVQGHTLDVYNGETTSTVDIFYGIPFAKTTAYENRFKNPIPPDPWDGVFVADTLGLVCPQRERGFLWFTHPEWGDKMSEDCLNLNIYSPDVNGGPYPVMVWIYGGGNEGGANIQYPGHFLASHGVVVVTVNYRLNKFGFASTGNDVVPGNAALFDQALGLQFVVDNIANFGGDPNKITLFGESAGATDISLHMLSPVSKDLFQQVILESGSETFGANSFVPRPGEDFYQAAEDLGCPSSPDEAMMECMRSLTWQHIWENSTNFGEGTIVDGPGGFVPMPARILREQGDIFKGPTITGITHDEGGIILPLIVPGTLFGCCDRPHYKHILENRLVGTVGRFLPNITQQNIVEAMMHVYSPWPNVYDNRANRNELVELCTDFAFGFGWNKHIIELQKVGPTWGFVYNYRGRNMTQLIPEWLGVPHISELAYVWGFTLLPLNPLVEEESMIQLDVIDWTEEDIRQTVFAQKLWTNFAKYGDPTPSPVENPLNTTTVWPQFTHDETNVLMISNTSIETVTQYRQPEYHFWTPYLLHIIGIQDDRLPLYDMAKELLSWPDDTFSPDFIYNYFGLDE